MSSKYMATRPAPLQYTTPILLYLKNVPKYDAEPILL